MTASPHLADRLAQLWETTALFAQLHVGDPGPDSQANRVQDVARQPVAFVAAGRQAALAKPVEWPNIPMRETVTHISVWDRLDGGNSWGNAPLDGAVPLSAGDSLRLNTFEVTIR